jgi:hypothetical protein
MQRQWQTRRTWRPDPAGQRRWDCAYQLLLRVASQPAAPPVPAMPEVSHESGSLRARLDAAPGAGPNH